MNMKINRLRIMLALVVMIAMISASLAVSPAAAGTTRISFTNYNIACSLTEGKVWVSEGGVVHIRGRILQSVIVSEGDAIEFFAGTGQIVGNANIFDPAFGLGTYFGSLAIYPTEMDGYWQGKWSMQITETGAKGIARLRGYGDLQGYVTRSVLYPLPPDVLSGFAYLCGGNQPVAGTLAVGEMLIPGGD